MVRREQHSLPPVTRYLLLPVTSCYPLPDRPSWRPGRTCIIIKISSWDNKVRKGGRSRYLPIPPDTCSLLFPPDTSRYLFPPVPSRYLPIPVPSCSLLFPPVPSCSILFPPVPSCSLLLPVTSCYPIPPDTCSLLFPPDTSRDCPDRRPRSSTSCWHCRCT